MNTRTALFTFASLFTVHCGAKTELIAPRITDDAATAADAAGPCQWRLGPLSPIAADITDGEFPQYGVLSEGAVGTDGLLWAWRQASSSRSTPPTLAWRAAMINFDGVQQGPSLLIERATLSTSGDIFDLDLIATREGFATLTWQPPNGHTVHRLSRDGRELSRSAPFGARSFGEDLAELSDGALRVFVGNRPVTTPRVTSVRVPGFVEVSRNNSVSPPRQGDRQVMARATFSDRTGVFVTLSADDTAFVAVRTNSDGQRTGAEVALQAWPQDRSIQLARMHVTPRGAVASWALFNAANATAAEVAEFSPRGELSLRQSLPFRNGAASAIRSISVDVSDANIFLTWTEETGRDSSMFARVFDRSGVALTDPLPLLSSFAPRSFIRATPRGALVYGVADRPDVAPAFAATIRCER